MSVNFPKIKKDLLCDALVKSALIGLAAGALVSGALVLILSLLEVVFFVGYYIAVGVLGALLVGAVSFLILRPRDRAVAKRLDEQYGLREKVQTMLAFEGEEGEMLSLQRENAEEALGNIPKKPPFYKRLALPLAAFVLCVAFLGTNVAVFAGGKEDAPTEVPEIPYSISEWQLGALELLIEDVSYSDIDEELKTDMVEELTRLLEVLKTVGTQRRMRSEVIASIVNIDFITEEFNSYKKIAIGLGTSKNLTTRLLAVTILSLSGVTIEENLKPMRELFAGQTYRTDMEDFVTETEADMAKLTVSEDDELLVAAKGFIANLAAVLKLTTTNETVIQARIDRAFNTAYDAIGSELSDQYANKSKRDYVILKLIEIFEIPEDEIPMLLGDIVPEIDLEGAFDSSDGSGKEDSGGYGDGNNLFGSDDVIYDPIYGENGAGYYKYGDVFSSYHQVIEDLLLYGDLNEETKRILIDYFARLSDGSKT